MSEPLQKTPSACPRCRSNTIEVRGVSPVAGAWTIFGLRHLLLCLAFDGTGGKYQSGQVSAGVSPESGGPSSFRGGKPASDATFNG
jgi:hypothetical protein